MEYIAVVIVVTLSGLCVVGGLVLFCINLRGVNKLLQGQPDREAEFLNSEMSASYDAARHMRGDA